MGKKKSDNTVGKLYLRETELVMWCFNYKCNIETWKGKIEKGFCKALLPSSVQLDHCPSLVHTVGEISFFF